MSFKVDLKHGNYISECKQEIPQSYLSSMFILKLKYDIYSLQLIILSELLNGIFKVSSARPICELRAIKVCKFISN